MFRGAVFRGALLAGGLLFGCARQSGPPARLRSAARSEAQPAQPANPATDFAARDRAIASALATAGVQAPAVLDATRDVDGDRVEDALFHAGSPVVYGVARVRGTTWTVDVLDRTTAPQEWPAWSDAVPLRRGAAVLLVRALAPPPEVANQALELLVLEPGSAPRIVWNEVFSTHARWTLRGVAPDRVELHGVIGTVLGQSIPDLHKLLREVREDRWEAMGCWGLEARGIVAPDGACRVTVPAGTRERSWEHAAFGPPSVRDTQVTLLYQGIAPPPAQRGTRNECVRSEGRTFWVDLPESAAASCAPDGQRP
jgi:hypothetical protein